MPEIIWKGTNGVNYWPSRDGKMAVAIADHIMEGTMESTDGWFRNPASEVSSHFGVAKDGRIWQWVKIQDTAWTNGNLEEGLDLSCDWLVECWANGVKSKQINPNRRTISIEHEGLTGERLTEKQYASTLWLHRQIIEQTGIKHDRQHIVGHYQISPKSKPDCPGTGFPWTRLIMDLTGEILPPDGAFDLNGYHVPEPFATYWKKNGGLPVFGLPIGNFTIDSSKYPPAQIYQFFERARLEVQPDGSITRGLVGAELLKLAGR